MPRGALVLFRKELLDAVRDRRSLTAGLLYGIWGPLVMALTLVAIARDRNADEPLRLATTGATHAQSLMAFLKSRSVEIVDAPADVTLAIRERRLPVAVVVDARYEPQFAAMREAEVGLFFDGSWSQSSAKARRVRVLLEDYGRRVGETRLVLRGIAPSAISPLAIVDRDLSTPASRGATVLAALPIFLLLAAFVGGMNVAADSAAGERERNSLESLLTHPVSRLAIVAGKWGAAATVALVTVLLTLLVSQAILRHPRIQAIDLPLGLSALDAIKVLAVLLPLALMAPALQVFVAFLSRSFKEAQTHLSLMLFVPMVPGFLLAFGTWQQESWMTWVPILGQHLLLSDVLRGVPLQVGTLGALGGITLVAGLVALGASARTLATERMVEGPEGPEGPRGPRA